MRFLRVTKFASWQAYLIFSEFIKCKSRHILNAENDRFIRAVLETSETRKQLLKQGDVLYRSQLAHNQQTHVIADDNGIEVESIEVVTPADEDRMLPQSGRAYEGRVNPKGIPCLYLSTDPDTAMAEVRPWIGAYMTVAKFELLRDLTVVDCSVDRRRYLRQLASDQWEHEAWADINDGFSKPVTRSDDVADYAPTQVLAEYFRFGGFAGIMYASTAGTGKNVALFDTKAARQMYRFLYQVKALRPCFVLKDEAGHT